MTIQESAPIPATLAEAPQADVEQSTTELQAVETPQEHPIVAHLRACLETSIEIADDYAGRGGKEREIAAWHLAQADRYDDEAMAKRADVVMWRVLIERAVAEVSAEQPPAAETRVNPYPPMIHCGECGTPIRPLTPQEQADVQAGHLLPDVRPECPDCLVNLAERVEPADTTP